MQLEPASHAIFTALCFSDARALQVYGMPSGGKIQYVFFLFASIMVRSCPVPIHIYGAMCAAQFMAEALFPTLVAWLPVAVRYCAAISEVPCLCIL